MGKQKHVLFMGIVLILIGVITGGNAAAAPSLKDNPTKVPKATPTPIYVVVRRDVTDYVDTLQIDLSAEASIRGSELTLSSMASPEIFAELNAALVDVWLQVQDREYNYRQDTGQYAQGLISHSTIPTDGSENFPDLFLRRPTDFPANWNDLNFLPYSPSAYAYQIDTYNSKWGIGYLFRVHIVLDGIRYLKTYSHGPINNSHDWIEVP